MNPNGDRASSRIESFRIEVETLVVLAYSEAVDGSMEFTDPFYAY